MNESRPLRSDSGLNRALGPMILIGVTASVVLELAGLVVYWRTTGGLWISSDASVYLSARGFAGLLGDLFRRGVAAGSGLGLMTIGIAVLILTPLARVVTSLVFFAFRRERRYVVLTLVVLLILSVSLAVH